MTAPLIASLELGGTKCIVSLAQDGRIVRTERVPTQQNPAETLNPLLDTLAVWAEEMPFEAIGVASFGPLGLDPSREDFGRILKTPKPGWSNFDVLGAVKARFTLPMGFDTDVGAAALAEGLWGASTQCSTHGYLTIGTGVGLGLVIDGRVHHGALHPEAGHVRLRRVKGDTFPGVCPFHGDCLEGLISGPALAARAGGPVHDLPADHILWDRVAQELGEFLAMLLLTTAAERIVLGGGVVLGRPMLLPRIHAATAALLGNYLQGGAPAQLQQRIRYAALGADAGPLGGAALALDALAVDRGAIMHAA